MTAMKQVEQIARSIQQCLREAGLEAEATITDHEGTVHVRVQDEARYLQVIAQVTDRLTQPANHGPVAFETARAHLGRAAIRPTLNVRAAAGEQGLTPATSRTVVTRKEPRNRTE